MTKQSLHGKTVLITGGGSGIGKAAAEAFVAAGARVALIGRDAAKVKTVAEALGGAPKAHARSCDVSSASQVVEAVRWATESLGRIDILVNNAGLNFKERSITQLTPESWDRMIGANLDGAFYCIHAVLPQMLVRKDGVIVNVSSIAGKRASTVSGPSYCAAKFGMAALSLAAGLDLRESGVRLSVVYPGEVDTPILEQRPQPTSDEQRKKMLRAEDVAAAILFVASLPPHASIPELVITPTRQGFA
jgi:NADP-dependent 3-hydroxy acid dehydrogenase YdfG